MKQFQHIDYFEKNLGLPTIAFDKLDGSNLRFEWSRKRGFYKFGTRRCIIEEKTEFYGAGIRIFLDKYASELDKVFRYEYKNTESFICYGEYFGPNSRFGFHDPTDKMDVVLFDIDQHKRGLIHPREFIKVFGSLHIPKVIYDGVLSHALYDKVYSNSVEGFENQLQEGVICKTTINDNNFGNLHYCKIKTKDWLEGLKIKCGEERLKEEFI